ncbi:thioredoxin family protein [Flavobacterium cerinum]|uniref:Thioredoxin family protein n=1 Tax=Flavobacterium cerinum TaxID=2502784 RepID=A0ABY5ISL1_9FLAO|nr:thioredoxin family protein [Flavobacterium cerinum]UUC45837.1 thioredoxin family protein [Flavobacterium cerinum]
MKKIVFVCIFALVSILTKAQDTKLEWHTDIKKAIQLSQQEKKPLFLFFTGSDWCGWCIRLQKEVFQQPEFGIWAKENVILVELDFPRRKALAPEIQQTNNQLMQLFGVRGYPTVWFVNATEKEGKVNFEKLGSSGYVAGGPEVWLKGANQILKNVK